MGSHYGNVLLLDPSLLTLLDTPSARETSGAADPEIGLYNLIERTGVPSLIHEFFHTQPVGWCKDHTISFQASHRLAHNHRPPKMSQTEGAEHARSLSTLMALAIDDNLHGTKKCEDNCETWATYSVLHFLLVIYPEHDFLSGATVPRRKSLLYHCSLFDSMRAVGKGSITNLPAYDASKDTWRTLATKIRPENPIPTPGLVRPFLITLARLVSEYGITDTLDDDLKRLDIRTEYDSPYVPIEPLNSSQSPKKRKYDRIEAHRKHAGDMGRDYKLQKSMMAVQISNFDFLLPAESEPSKREIAEEMYTQRNDGLPYHDDSDTDGRVFTPRKWKYTVERDAGRLL